MLSADRANVRRVGGRKRKDIENVVDVQPLYYATSAYKIWARARYKAKGLTLITLASAIERADPTVTASSGGLSQFFGPEDETPRPSNTALMPGMNKALGAAPPPICDPTKKPIEKQVKLIQDRIAERWSLLTPNERRALLSLLGDESQPES